MKHTGFEGDCAAKLLQNTKTRVRLTTVNDGSMEAVLNEAKPKRHTWGPAALDERRERTRNHLAKIAVCREDWIKRNRYYYELLNRLLCFLIEPEKRVLSVRCGTGNLLAV
ncbi:MAG TPA: hypothetical protein VIW67_27175, partial [Terriglobales bacterium]